MNEMLQQTLLKPTPRRYTPSALLAVFLIGVIFGAGGYGFFSKASILSFEETEKEISQKEDVVAVDGGIEEKTKKDKPAPLKVSVSGNNTLVVNDQVAGKRVIMSMVLISQNGWVAIHEIAPDGTFGKILGAQRLEKGQHFSEVIDLLRETKGGSKYAAVLHADDGDSMFDFRREIPVRNVAGDFVESRFFAIFGGPN